MKISRIKTIKNIGTFSNFDNGGSLGFEQLTFIYGYNTYGKTTLTDIFHSLKEDNPQVLQARQTIPKSTSQQKILLSIKDDTEQELKFENDQWSKNTISKNLEVFGTGFIHKNLFTGLTIERPNKENFTQFIIGEQGVKTANEIAQKRKELSEERKLIKTKMPNYVKGKTEDDIQRFLDLSIEGLVIDEIETNLTQKKITLQQENDRIKEPNKILHLEDPVDFVPAAFSIIETLQSINCLLQEDYSNIKDEVLIKISKHFTENFSTQDGAENWIRDGLHYCRNKESGGCPFCGQPLCDASNLITTYDACFDQAYKDFIDKCEQSLASNKKKIERTIFSQAISLLKSAAIFEKYNTLIDDIEFKDKLEVFKKTINLLKEDELNNEKNSILETIELKCEQKNKQPHKKSDILTFSKLRSLLSSYEELTKELKILFDVLSVKVQIFKKQYKNPTAITASITSLMTKIETLESQKARIHQDNNCREYMASQTKIKTLESEIPNFEDALKKDQSQYLEDYFSEINNLFKGIGSKNFTLEKESNAQGHMPVYSLKVKFHGTNIANDQLQFVFSDSDRRALAFTIFWAKLNLKNQADKEKTIIILDDPVVSFDDNRITKTINLIKETISQVSQVIILTHYPNFIKRFCEITKEAHITTKYLEIIQNETTSILTLSDRKHFTMSDYERIFMDIYNFINKKSNLCVKTKLRPFLEHFYLPTIYARQIQDKKVDCSSLDKMIDGIFDDNEETKTKLHSLRETLNPDSHILTSNNNEDVRTFAIDMMNYLFPLHEAVSQ